MQMPWVTELISIANKSAPILASALQGDYSSVAMSLIQAVFGGGSPIETLHNISNDPLAQEKLKALETKHCEALTKLSIDDRMDARKMEGAERFRHWLVGGLILLIVGDVVAIQLVTDNQLDHFLMATLGGLVVELKNVFKLYFGG